MRLDHAGEFGAHGLGFGSVDRHAGAAAAAGRIDDIEDAAFAGDNDRQALDEGRAGGAQTHGFVAGGAVEQFQFARHRVGRIDGLDRARIGGIGEDEMAVAVARPDRRR